MPAGSDSWTQAKSPGTGEPALLARTHLERSMALTLEVHHFPCTAGLDKPYVATLLEDGHLIAQLAYYPSAEAAIEAGLKLARERGSDPNPPVTVRVAP